MLHHLFETQSTSSSNSNISLLTKVVKELTNANNGLQGKLDASKEDAAEKAVSVVQETDACLQIDRTNVLYHLCSADQDRKIGSRQC